MENTGFVPNNSQWVSSQQHYTDIKTDKESYRLIRNPRKSDSATEKCVNTLLLSVIETGMKVDLTLRIQSIQFTILT